VDIPSRWVACPCVEEDDVCSWFAVVDVDGDGSEKQTES